MKEEFGFKEFIIFVFAGLVLAPLMKVWYFVTGK